MTLMRGQCSPTHAEVLGKSLNYAELALPFAKKKERKETKPTTMYLPIPIFSNQSRNIVFFKALHIYTLQKYKKM